MSTVLSGHRTPGDRQRHYAISLYEILAPIGVGGMGEVSIACTRQIVDLELIGG